MNSLEKRFGLVGGMAGGAIAAGRSKSQVSTLRFLLLILLAGVPLTKAVAEPTSPSLRLGVGLAIPRGELGVTTEQGVDLMGQYLNGIHSNIDIGAQLDWINFGKNGSVGYSTDQKLRSSVSAISFMVIGKLHPASAPSGFMPYGLLGAGVATTESMGKTSTTAGGEKNDFTFAAGGGIDIDFKNGYGAGIDLRYQTLNVMGVGASSFFAAMLHLAFL